MMARDNVPSSSSAGDISPEAGAGTLGDFAASGDTTDSGVSDDMVVGESAWHPRNAFTRSVEMSVCVQREENHLFQEQQQQMALHPTET